MFNCSGTACCGAASFSVVWSSIPASRSTCLAVQTVGAVRVGFAAGKLVLENRTWKEGQCVTEAEAAAGASAALLAAG